MLAASHLGTGKVHNSFVILWDPELGIMQGVALKAEEHACIKRHITMPPWGDQGQEHEDARVCTLQ